MISLHSGEFLETTIKDLIISSERVAHVQVGNNLEHALLVLTKTGYTAVPVLDPTYKLKGLISSTVILDGILGLERIEFDRLESMVVEDVMMKNIPILHIDDQVPKALELVVDHPFICVVNDNHVLEGILTRRSILKRLNSHIRRLNNTR